MFPSLYFVWLSGFLSSPSWVGVYPYACVQAPDHQEDSGADQGPLQLFDYSGFTVNFLDLLSIWFFPQQDLSLGVAETSTLLIHLPPRLLLCPSITKALDFSTFCSQSSQPLSSCKAAVFKACIEGQNYWVRILREGWGDPVRTEKALRGPGVGCVQVFPCGSAGK